MPAKYPRICASSAGVTGSGMKSTREALIALLGLCLSTGRFEDACALLLSLTAQVEGPRVGPRPSDEQKGGDTLDTGLWWVVTVDRFREATGDHEFIRSKLQGALLAILEGYRAGTRRGVGVSAEGLLGHEDGANPLGLTTGETARRGFAERPSRQSLNVWIVVIEHQQQRLECRGIQELPGHG